jgi:hypothetical protein
MAVPWRPGSLSASELVVAMVVTPSAGTGCRTGRVRFAGRVAGVQDVVKIDDAAQRQGLQGHP